MIGSDNRKSVPPLELNLLIPYVIIVMVALEEERLESFVKKRRLW